MQFALAISPHAFGGGHGGFTDPRASGLGFRNGGRFRYFRSERSGNAALPVSPITFAIAEHGWVRQWQLPQMLLLSASIISKNLRSVAALPIAKLPFQCSGNRLIIAIP